MNETDYAQLVRDAEDVAAQRTRMGVKPRGGPTRFPARGPYEESNITDLTNPFPTSLGQAGLMLALGPLAGRYLGKVGAEIGPGIIRKLLAPSAALPVGAAAGGAMLDPEEAQARFNAAMVARRFVPVPKGSTGYKPGLVVPRSRITVEDPLRAANPGIYTKDPRQIAAEAAALVQQEDPSLQQIFGVSRQDLYDIAQQRVRQYGGANMPSLVRLPPNPRGSAAAQRIMTPQNEQRILDIMMEGQKYPQLERPMRAWYVQDPIYDIYGNRVPNPEDRFNQFNVFHSMASPGSAVNVEIPRGTAAHYMHQQGRWPDFAAYGGGTPERDIPQTLTFPRETLSIPGHMYHPTSHVLPMEKMIEELQAGNLSPQDLVQMTRPKVPAYIGASGVPQTGFNWNDLVGDVHFAGGIGMHDVRTAQQFRKSLETPEFASINPWWRQKIADPFDMTPVEAQGYGWGLFAPQTGVATDIGRPKLELQAMRIAQRARELGVDPLWLRDVGLMPELGPQTGPKGYEGKFIGHWAAPLFAAPAMGELLTQDQTRSPLRIDVHPPVYRDEQQ